MKRCLIVTAVVILLSPFVRLDAQSDSGKTSELLQSLFNRLRNEHIDESRIRIADSINLTLDRYISHDNDFFETFSDVRYLGQVMSTDSLVRIVTWNLVLEKHPVRYYCYFIKRQSNTGKTIVYKLSTGENVNPVLRDTTITASDWYGALYYHIRPVTENAKTSYMLLGISYSNPAITKKFIDLVDLNDDGSLVLGRKWFKEKDESVYRVVFEYASDARMTLRFTNDSTIVFDHLAPFTPANEGDHRYYGPDYSFDSYSFTGSEWIFRLNVDIRNKE